MNDFDVPVVYIDTVQELLVKQLFVAIQVCSIKRWSPQHTHAHGATRLRSTCLHAPQPDSARVTVTSTTVQNRCSQETDVDRGSVIVH